MLEIQILAWDKHKNVAELNLLMGSQLFPLDNWIYNGNSHDKKQTCTESLLLQKTTQYHMDSTIAGLTDH
jgi:hypothetical protein